MPGWSYFKCMVDSESFHPPLVKAKGVRRRIHQLCREEKFKTKLEKALLAESTFMTIALMPFARLAWHLYHSVQFCRELIVPSKRVRRGVSSILCDAGRMARVFLIHKILPRNYYVFDFHKGPLSACRAQSTFTGPEFHYLGRHMRRFHGYDIGRLDQKNRFMDFCREAGLPYLPDVRQVYYSDPPLASEDLFAKPVDSFGGDRCLLIPAAKDGKEWHFDGSSLSFETLVNRLEDYFNGKEYVLQRRVRNHPLLMCVHPDVLTTLRVLTALDADGHAVILRATFRFPLNPEAHVDNSSLGGVAAPVDPETGIITGAAVDWVSEERWNQFPGSLSCVTGFQLPLWGIVRDVAISAQENASPISYIGWDIAISESGVFLNECNVWSDIELVQLPQGRPILGELELACLLADPSIKLSLS